MGPVLLARTSTLEISLLQCKREPVTVRTMMRELEGRIPCFIVLEECMEKEGMEDGFSTHLRSSLVTKAEPRERKEIHS